MLQRVLVLQSATFMSVPMNTVVEAKAGATVFIAGGWYAEKMQNWGLVRILGDDEIIPDGVISSALEEDSEDTSEDTSEEEFDDESDDEEDLEETPTDSSIALSSEAPTPRPRGRPRKNP